MIMIVISQCIRYSKEPLYPTAKSFNIFVDFKEQFVHSTVRDFFYFQLSGARHQCSLFVDKVTRHMHGDWMCLLNEISQFNSGIIIFKSSLHDTC